MTLNETKNIINETAAEYGFKTSEVSYQRLPVICSEELNFHVMENADVDWQAKKATVRVEVTASVRKMGGNPTVEDLLQTADEIRRGAELVARLQGMELAFSEEF